MRRIFERMKKAQEFVSLYLGYDDEGITMGYILEMKNNEMLVFNIDSQDKISEGSFLWLDSDEIYRLKIEGLDEKRSLAKRKLFPEEILSRRLEELHLETGDDETLQQAFLKYAKNNGRFVECMVPEYAYVGEVEEVTDSFLLLRQVDYYGRGDGRVYILLDSIQEIYVDSEECRAAELLMREHKEQEKA